jgi:hypothetical protein
MACAASFTVSIPYSSPSGDAGHTIYSIDVLEDDLGLAYTVGRRFSEFDALRERLALEADEAPLSSSFPPKKWFWNMAPEVVEERRQQLEVWLQEAFLLVASGAQPELEDPLLEFIDARARLEEIEAERHAAKLRKIWTKMQRPAVCGPNTRLHLFAGAGQAELLRNALREIRGDHDWLPTVDQSRNSAPTAYDPAEEDRIVGLLDARSNPDEASVLRAEDGATLDTLPLPAERAALPATTAVGTVGVVDRSMEVAVSGLHSELALALRASSAALQRDTGRPLGTLDAGDSNGRTAFVLACGAGHRECVRALVLAGCSTELVDNDGMTGWDWAATPPGQPVVLQELERLAEHRRGQEQSQSAVATPPLTMESRIKQLDSGRSKHRKGNTSKSQKHNKRGGRRKGSQIRSSTAVI